MATYDWSVALWQSGNTYTAENSFPRPNQDLETQRISTLQKLKLANGGNAYLNPETKFTREPFQVFWADTTSAFRTQLETYITNGDKIKITTHTSEVFTVKITGYNRIWLTGQSPDSYDIAVTMEQVS